MNICQGLYQLISTASLADCQRYLSVPELANAIRKCFQKYQARPRVDLLVEFLEAMIERATATCYKPGVTTDLESCTGRIMFITGDCSICVLEQEYKMNTHYYYYERVLPKVDSCDDLYFTDDVIELWLSVL